MSVREFLAALKTPTPATGDLRVVLVGFAFVGGLVLLNGCYLLWEQLVHHWPIGLSIFQLGASGFALVVELWFLRAK